MPTNQAGSTARNTLMQVPHTIYADIDFEDTAVNVGTIPAGSLILKSQSSVNVTTAFNATTTNTVHVGTSADNDLYATSLAAGSVAQVPFDEFTSGNLVTSDTTITATYNQSGTAATAGQARVVVMYLPPNG